tara:strand:- start:130082 stop:131251 length:1170 start_codon:yes stop_codon:yes gene_type:complete
MTLIDTSKSFEPLEAKDAPRKRSFTEKSGHSAFEDALIKWREQEDSGESSVHADAQPQSAPEVTSTPRHVSSSRQETGTAAVQQGEGTAPAGKVSDNDGPNSTASDEAEATQDTVASASEEAITGSAIDSEASYEDVSAEGGELELSEEAWSEVDAEPAEEATPADLAASDAPEGLDGSGEEASGESLQDDAGSADEMQFDGDPDVTFEVSSSPEASSAPDLAPANAPSAPAAAPSTFVESFGRQAFARSTQLHRAETAAPASLDMNDLVEQIAKVRGSMTTGRARVVIGEGSDRLALTVQLRNGMVNIDARVADAGLAQSLERGSSELAEALSKHGLSLGTMDTGGGGGETLEHRESSAESGAEFGAEPVLEPATQTSRVRRGVRIVA